MWTSSRWRLVVLGVVATLGSVTAARGEPLVETSAASVAASVAARVARDGAVRVLADLDRQPAQLEAVLAGIETADPAWLRVGTDLRPPADGANAEQLDMAFARALPNEPERVLSLVDHGVSLARICASPFIEPVAGVAEAYEARTLWALATVRPDRLRPLAAACARRVKLPVR